MRAGDEFRPTTEFFTATVENATCTVTAPAKTNLAFHLTGWGYSFNGTPAAVVQAELRNGSVVRVRHEVAAVYIPPLMFNYHYRPWEFDKNTAVNLVVPALGASIRCSAWISGFYSTPSAAKS